MNISAVPTRIFAGYKGWIGRDGNMHLINSAVELQRHADRHGMKE
jgi:hypothetical protein